MGKGKIKKIVIGVVLVILAGLGGGMAVRAREYRDLEQKAQRLGQKIEKGELDKKQYTNLRDEIKKNRVFYKKPAEEIAEYFDEIAAAVEPLMRAEDEQVVSGFFERNENKGEKKNENENVVFLEKKRQELAEWKEKTETGVDWEKEEWGRQKWEKYAKERNFLKIVPKACDLAVYKNKRERIGQKWGKIEEILGILEEEQGRWKLEEGKVVFLKRASFEKIKEPVVTIRLVEDKTPPEIELETAVVLAGEKPKIKCIDAVDEEVECKIEKEPDLTKIGKYDLEVEAVDKSGNKARKTVTVTVRRLDLSPYYIKVSKTHQVVIVYGLDENEEYTRVVKTFLASTGLTGNTPVGLWKTRRYQQRWSELVGNVYGQYPVQIVGFFWFHSVPYLKPANDKLEWEEYNKLGSPASAGCVRLRAQDIKWIYDNVPDGTQVEIYEGALPVGIEKPVVEKIGETDARKNWDPTDPEAGNPWRL